MSHRKRKNEEANEHASSNAAEKSKVSKYSMRSETKFMRPAILFILKAGIQKNRLNLFKTQVEKFGGCVKDSITCDTTHIVVDEDISIERLCKILKNISPPEDKAIVKSCWLSTCFRQKAFVDPNSFTLNIHLNIPIKTDKSDKETEKYVSSWDESKHEESKISEKEIEKDVSSWDDSNSEKSNIFDKETEKDVISLDESKPEDSSIPERPPDKHVVSKQKQLKIDAFLSKTCKSPAKEEKEMKEDSDYVTSDEEILVDNTLSSNASSSAHITPTKSSKKDIAFQENWVCFHSSKNPMSNQNEHITAVLEEMVKNYQSTNDRWRAISYQKAIAALKRHPKKITSLKEARTIPGVGKKLADKILEITQSGELRQLNEFRSNEQIRVIKLFTDVWGAGPVTALQWYQQGFRTLEDLRSKAKLTQQQKVGVRLYDDILNRMPREEAAEIEQVVRTAAESIQPGIICQACGSYRRGKQDCGDVDVLITHPDGHSEKGIFSKLIHHLRKTGFLTDDLVSGEEKGHQKKYLGVCKLPGPNQRHRRLDIIVVPYEEYACALLYFTGSAHFTRSMRSLCKKKGMSLNEHALKIGVVRKGTEKIFEGTVVPTPTEESVFKFLGIPYRPPEERDH